MTRCSRHAPDARRPAGRGDGPHPAYPGGCVCISGTMTPTVFTEPIEVTAVVVDPPEATGSPVRRGLGPCSAQGRAAFHSDGDRANRPRPGTASHHGCGNGRGPPGRLSRRRPAAGSRAHTPARRARALQALRPELVSRRGRATGCHAPRRHADRRRFRRRDRHERPLGKRAGSSSSIPSKPSSPTVRGAGTGSRPRTSGATRESLADRRASPGR